MFTMVAQNTRKTISAVAAVAIVSFSGLVLDQAHVAAAPRGTIEVGDRQIRIRAVRAGGKRIRDAVEKAYAIKYPTPGSVKYVRGFRTLRRRETTIEFVPR